MGRNFWLLLSRHPILDIFVPFASLGVSVMPTQQGQEGEGWCYKLHRPVQCGLMSYIVNIQITRVIEQSVRVRWPTVANSSGQTICENAETLQMPSAIRGTPSPYAFLTLTASSSSKERGVQVNKLLPF